MSKNKDSKLDITSTMKRALDDLERVELDFNIEEPEAKAKKIEGRLVAFLRDSNDTQN